MQFIKLSLLALLAAGSTVACAAETSDSSGTGGGIGVGTGGALGTGGTVGASGGTVGATGGTVGATGGTVSSTGGAVGTGGGSSTCAALATGPSDVAEQWWAGTSETSTDAVIAAGNKGIKDATGVVGLDMWGGPTGWANVSYSFAAMGACVNAVGKTSVSISVTATVAGKFRFALKTQGSSASSNHMQKTVDFTAGQTQVVTLNLDGSGLTNSWVDPAAPAWDPGHLLSVVVIPLTVDAKGLAPYDFSASSVTVN